MLMLFCAAILGSLCACSFDPSDSTDSSAINCERNLYNYMVEGDKGFYFLCENLIVFWDGDLQHQAMPICSKTGCAHDSWECIAWTSSNTKIFYRDGGVYVFSGTKERDPVTQSVGYPLWRIAADGSGKEIVRVVRESPHNYTIFQDALYYESRTEDDKSICSVFCLPLDGGEEKRIFESQYQNGGLSMLQGIGEYLYFNERGVDPELDLTDTTWNLDTVEEVEILYRYDPKNGDLRSNPLNEKEGFHTIIRNVYDGKLYYNSWKDEEENQLLSKAVDGQTEAVCLREEPLSIEAADTQYLYATYRDDTDEGGHGNRIYDYDGNVIQEFEMHGIDFLQLFPANDAYVFGKLVKMVDEAAGQVEVSIVLLEREKLADGTAEMIPLMTVQQ